MSGGARRAGQAPDGARFVKAAAIVALLMGAVAVSGTPASAGGPDVLAEAADPSLWGIDGPEGVGRVLAEGRLGSGAARPPNGFEDEVLPLEGRSETQADEHANVVGFVEGGTPAEAFRRLSGELASRGWIGIESGRDACGTFAKPDGAYRWLFASCVQVSGGTSVVVQYATADDERG